MKLATWIATGILLALLIAAYPLALFDSAYLIGPSVIWVALLLVRLQVSAIRADRAAWKICPFCRSQIPSAATVCRECTRDL